MPKIPTSLYARTSKPLVRINLGQITLIPTFISTKLIFPQKAEKEEFCRIVARDLIDKALEELDKTREVGVQCELLTEGPKSSSTPIKGKF